jgi:hypothetical protein
VERGKSEFEISGIENQAGEIKQEMEIKIGKPNNGFPYFGWNTYNRQRECVYI